MYDMERTVCDILRSRNSVETQVFQDTLKMYAKRRDKNLHHLADYAKLFRVENLRMAGIFYVKMHCLPILLSISFRMTSINSLTDSEGFFV